jgi:hypothetical protein
MVVGNYTPRGARSWTPELQKLEAPGLSLTNWPVEGCGQLTGELHLLKPRGCITIRFHLSFHTSSKHLTIGYCRLIYVFHRLGSKDGEMLQSAVLFAGDLQPRFLSSDKMPPTKHYP